MDRLRSNFIKYPFWITAVICLIFYFLPFKPKPFGDGEYHQGTIDLIAYILNGFHGDVRVDKGLFTLFYYLIPYSAVYYFKSQTLFYLSGIVFNSLVTCFSIDYLFRAFRIMGFSEKSKFLTLMLLCLFPVHVYYAFGILAEAAAFFAVSIIVYLWTRIVISKEDSIARFLQLSLATVALVGIRPNLLPFAILFLIFVLFIKVSIKAKATFITSFILLMALMASFENTLNNTDGEFKKTVFRNQILWSRFELRDEPVNWLPQHGQDQFASGDYLNNLAKRRELDSICVAGHLDKTPYYLNWVKNDIISHPIITIRQYFLKFFQSQSFIISPLMKSAKPKMIKYGIHIYINLINYILVFGGLLGVIKMAKEKRYALLLPMVFLWAWSLLYIFLFHSEQRYMFPVRPVVAFLFAFYANYIFSKRKNSIATATNSVEI